MTSFIQVFQGPLNRGLEIFRPPQVQKIKTICDLPTDELKMLDLGSEYLSPCTDNGNISSCNKFRKTF